MRLHNLHWLLCAASSTVSATTSPARVYLYDHDAPSSLEASPASEAVDPATARLIFAQRLDLGQFHEIENADDEMLQQINAYSSKRQPLFKADREAEDASKVVIMVEGANDVTVPNQQSFRSFSISPAPHPADTHELFSTFSSEAAAMPFTDGPEYHVLRAIAPLSELPGSSLQTFRNRRTLLHVKNVDAKVLSAVLEDLQDLAKSQRLSFSLLISPPSHLSSKAAKMPYGLAKRSAKALRAQPEEPLISKDGESASKSLVSPVSPYTATRVLGGAVPTCFSSLNACQRRTNNCTSHGDCILKWSADSKNEDGTVSKQDCFGCACTKPDIRKNKDGSQKTTRFGGAACNKIDIVFPFWLLAGTSIFIIFIISWGIGLLYEMGNQDLPSVIGAGVSGPKPR